MYNIMISQFAGLLSIFVIHAVVMFVTGLHWQGFSEIMIVIICYLILFYKTSKKSKSDVVE